jgi:hypothetical protein
MLSGSSTTSTPVKGGKASTSGQPSPFTYRPSVAAVKGVANKVCLSSKDISMSISYFVSGSTFC